MSDGARGSVFIESMVAAAIVAVMLSVTYAAIAESAARHRAVDARRVALLVAQSELAAVGTEIPLEPGSTTGVDGSYAWRVDVAATDQGLSVSHAGSLRSVWVSVRDVRGGPALAGLHTLRLAPGGPT